MLNPETVLVLATPLAGWAGARFRWRWPGALENCLARLAARQRLAVLIVAAAPVLLRLALLPWFPAPQPHVHDEFSFLLAADTFVHGRVANPPLAAYAPFESMHILTRPSYASAFPIGPAIFLALGALLTGYAWAGVLLSIAFMCGAVCWMLQGYIPPRWALLGAALLALRLGVSSYWMNSYWGGAVAAGAGALAMGVLPRIFRRPNWRDALIMGAGLALLAHSRPFEGGVLGVLVAAAILIRPAKLTAPLRRSMLRKAAVPLGVFLAFVAAASAWYFYRVTGSPFDLPYSLYRSSLTVAPHFVWQTPRPAPLYNNGEMRFYFTKLEMRTYNMARSAPLSNMLDALTAYWRFYFGPLLSLPLLALTVLWQNGRWRLALLAAAIFAAALLPEVWHNPHYAAPATGLMFFIVVMGMRHLRLLRWRGLPIGLYTTRMLPLACAAMLAVQIAAGRPSADAEAWAGWRWPPLYTARARIVRQLETTPGRHLVLVRYGRPHDTGDEWVYNAARIEDSKIVWARELDPESNRDLIRQFPGRSVWLIEPDQPSPHLQPYAGAPFRPMHFVPLGAPAIAVLQPGERLRRSILERAAAPANTCAAWNGFFTEATGVDAPPLSEECLPPNQPPVSFDRWYAWLRRQR